MAIECRKRTLTLIWGLLECLFFAGILNGWIWLHQILKDDHYYLDACNSSLPVEPNHPKHEALKHDGGLGLAGCRLVAVKVENPIGFTLPPFAFWATQSHEAVRPMPMPSDDNVTTMYCDSQDSKLELIFTLVIIIRNLLMLPLGIFLDRYGTCRTRILAITFSTFGSLTMLFTSEVFPLTMMPALTLLGVSGYLILLTDIQIANLFGSRRYTIMSVFVGVYFSGGITPMLIMSTRKHGINLQTSFMFITIGIIPVLISTIMMLPRSRIPWPLPANYGKTRSGVSKEEKLSTRNQGWQRRISAGTKKRANGRFSIIIRSSHYVWLLVWFSVLTLKSFVHDMNIDVLMRGLHVGGEEQVSQYLSLYALVLLCSVLAAPFIGVVMDWHRQLVQDPIEQQMKNILHAIVITYVISVCSSVTSLIPIVNVQIISFISFTVEKVALLATTCAFLTHVHFPGEHFGKSMGLVIACSGVVLVAQFPLKFLIYNTFHADPFYVHLILLFTLLLAAGHPVNVYYQCHMGNIQGRASTQGPVAWSAPRLMENIVEIKEDVKHVVKSTPIVKTRLLQITDL